jgi:mannose-6-phosphate isomerase-like protein (cupin superfamily)
MAHAKHAQITGPTTSSVPAVGSTTDAEVVYYARLPGTPCPCGIAKRGLTDSQTVPFSLHITQIASTARTHYHKRLTETYLVLECDEGAYLELDGKQLPLEPEMAVVIPPGTRHRAVGKIKVAIVVCPKFDPEDEWFDD